MTNTVPPTMTESSSGEHPTPNPQQTTNDANENRRQQVKVNNTMSDGDPENGGVRSYLVSELEAFNLSQRPIWVCLCGEEWGDKKRLVWGNTACIRLWNASSLEQILKRDFNTDMSEPVKQRYHNVARRCGAGEVFSQQWTYYPGGKATTVTVTFSEVWIDENNGKDPLPAVLADVQNTPEIREEVTAEGLRSFAMLQHLPVAVAQFDAKGTVMLENPQSHSLFLAPDENDENQGDWCEFVRRFRDKKIGQDILMDVTSEGTDYNIEAEQNTTNGPRWFALSVKRNLDPVTGASTLLYSARDITQIVNAKKLEHESKVKSEFMSVVAHEIRTPFHQVNGFVELLSHTELSAQQREHVNHITIASIGMMSILNDLLDFNKLEAGKMKIESIQFCPKDVSNASFSAVASSAEKKGLLIRQDLDTDDIPQQVMGDPNRLRQVLLNLLNNAIKFSSKGEVSLHVSRIRNTDVASDVAVLEFSVQDTGIGIASEHRENIFRKYQQADVAVARQYGGTGLGLAICSSLVEAMAGKIGVDSEIGQGSRFWFRIPFQLPTVEPLSDLDATAVGSSSAIENEFGDEQCFHVLVVDDNKMNLKLAKSMLERMGHTVQLASDGVEAISAIESRNSKGFDLVLMDVQMPIMDGLEATKRIRETLSLVDLPILGLTADFRPSELGYYKEVGMNSCIGKPVRFKQLKDSVLDVVTTRRNA